MNAGNRPQKRGALWLESNTQLVDVIVAPVLSRMLNSWRRRPASATPKTIPTTLNLFQRDTKCTLG
ncbi:unnamed protein product [Amoebophrya sp. A25]|nr:unnamed protein product [Amoebophrya sp. A25]|eukprot:GSA25T00004170001.1